MFSLPHSPALSQCLVILVSVPALMSYSPFSPWALDLHPLPSPLFYSLPLVFPMTPFPGLTSLPVSSPPRPCLTIPLTGSRAFLPFSRPEPSLPFSLPLDSPTEPGDFEESFVSSVLEKWAFRLAFPGSSSPPSSAPSHPAPVYLCDLVSAVDHGPHLPE